MENSELQTDEIEGKYFWNGEVMKIGFFIKAGMLAKTVKINFLRTLTINQRLQESKEQFENNS